MSLPSYRYVNSIQILLITHSCKYLSFLISTKLSKLTSTIDNVFNTPKKNCQLVSFKLFIKNYDFYLSRESSLDEVAVCLYFIAFDD